MRQFIPGLKKNASIVTPRDVTNVLLIGFITTIVAWLLCDVANLRFIPREVAAAFGGVVGYFFARRFRY